VGRKSRLAARDAAGGGSAGFNLADARRHVLPNGLTVILLENHRLPILAATALVRNVRLSEPAEKAGVATLTGGMLDEGTADHAGGEIAGLIEDAGGDLTMSSNGGAVKVLAPDRPLGLGLLVECLSRPTFPADAFDRVKDSLLSRIEEAETDPQEIAQRTFASLVFGPHPLGRSTLGTRPTAERLTAADCKAFHARLFVPNNTAVAVVGDFDSVEVLAELTKLTEKWQRAEVERPALPAVEVSAKPTEKIITVPDAAQLHIYLGHVGVRRDSPDYYKLLVMDNILGTGPGFTDRLSAELRDRRGLAYTVTAQVASSAGEEPGAFTGYIGTYPDKFTVVRDGFLTEVNRIRKEAPTPAEVEGARQYLLGSLPFRLTDSERVAEQLLTAERFGLGFDWFDKYRKSVSAVTPEEVRQVAEKYLKPDRLVLVAAGPVDAKGKPLPPPKE
jgi:zinc protease